MRQKTSNYRYFEKITCQRPHSAGFTLLELTIVLLIVGLLFAGVLGPLSTRIEQKDRQTTTDMLEDIREALLGFTVTSGRLPCPDVVGVDGVEDRAAGPATPNRVCDAAFGNLPWSTLGVPEFDSWGRHFLYGVTLLYGRETNAVTPLPCGTATNGVAFELCSVADNVVSTAVSGGGIIVANNVPAVVLSRGSNNDCSPLETENDDGTFCTSPVIDQNFVFAGYNQTVGGEFDDIVIWISPNILNHRMVQAGRLP